MQGVVTIPKSTIISDSFGGGCNSLWLWLCFLMVPFRYGLATVHWPSILEGGGSTCEALSRRTDTPLNHGQYSRASPPVSHEFGRTAPRQDSSRRFCYCRESGQLHVAGGLRHNQLFHSHMLAATRVWG